MICFQKDEKNVLENHVSTVQINTMIGSMLSIVVVIIGGGAYIIHQIRWIEK